MIKSVEALCNLKEPYRFPKDYDELFARSMREIIDWHATHSEFYRKVLKERSFDSGQVQSIKDCEKIPFIPANFFKTHEVFSVPKDQIALHLTSSGTTGQKSQMFFDSRSLKAGQQMVDFVFDSFAWTTPQDPVNYLLYTYETKPDSKLGTAHTDNFLCKYAPINNAFYALRWNGSGSHDFDVFGCIQKFKEYEKAGLPVRVFGFPAFFNSTLERMRELGERKLKLSANSLVVLGGGWKGSADQAVPKDILYSRVEELLGIPARRIRDSFGSVEHAVPYMECEGHHFHVPVWSHVIIRDVRTFEPLRFGEKGFLQFLTPYITSVPAHSVLMGDLASLHPGEDCPCSIESPFFVIHGRAGTSKNRSCAVAASELLER